MIYFILVIIIVGVGDIKNLIAKNKNKEIYAYIVFMILVTILGIFYYSNPERNSFSKVLISLVGKEE